MGELQPFEVYEAIGAELEHEAVSPEQTVAGAPETGVAELGALGGVGYGIWEMTAGAMRDIEADEVFVVLEGTGEVELLQSGATVSRISLRPGSIVRLAAGMSTVWTVPERLRKFYIAIG